MHKKHKQVIDKKIVSFIKKDIISTISKCFISTDADFFFLIFCFGKSSFLLYILDWLNIKGLWCFNLFTLHTVSWQFSNPQAGPVFSLFTVTPTAGSLPSLSSLMWSRTFFPICQHHIRWSQTFPPTAGKKRFVCPNVSLDHLKDKNLASFSALWGTQPIYLTTVQVV